MVNHVKAVIESKLNLENVIDVNQYSDAEKLYQITALVLHFINNLHVKSKQRPGNLLLENLSAKEISSAEQLWVKECQREIQGTRNSAIYNVNLSCLKTITVLFVVVDD